MRRANLWLIGLVLWSLPARAEDRPGKLVRDVWDAAYLGKAKIGYVHTTVSEMDRGSSRS